MRRRTIALMAAIVLAATAWTRVALAQSEDTKVVRTIVVSGDGEVQAAPDQATLDLAIETHAATASEAAGLNGSLAQKVRDALKAKLTDKGTMWTGGYSLSPDYNEPRNGDPAKIIGYRAQNSITVQTQALDIVGPLIDAAIAAGANQVNSLDYTLRDNTKARGDAIAKASRDAQAQAEALAAALGVKLGQVLKATTEAESRPVPMMRMQALAMSRGGATPIEVGQVTVPATVSLTYAIQ
ncbi:MAG TPA: SIMPL domain-containing protein [Candidatus Binataceae bacterium]|nr:SIMPL domain-containing protein [Candidatus Binataceae bacterium]